MLTVAAILQSATVSAGERWNATAHALGRDGRIGEIARQDGHELLAAEAADRRRTARRLTPMRVAAKGRSASSPSGWPKRSLIDLKWSRSNISTLTGSLPLGLPRDQLVCGREEAAPVEQAGQSSVEAASRRTRTLRSLASTSTMKAVPTT